ncbi:MAG: lysophospholipase [Defluviitaleaceae bacterium]|nr:lysophospholipase [Defluviitaleaceae bacterium]
MCKPISATTVRRHGLKIVNAHDNIPIRVAIYEPDAVPIGVLQIVHGFGEGIGHYNDVTEFFTGHGYACVMHDQRGFGEMPGMTPEQRKSAQGIAPSFGHFLHDIKTLRGEIGRWYPGLPIVLFGHSMGGNIVANYLLKFPDIYRCVYKKAIIEAPWLRLYKPMPKVAVAFARVIGKLSSKAAVTAKLSTSYITRDKEKLDSLLNSGFYHSRISLQLFAEITAAGEYAIKNVARITTPTLLLSPGGDRIVCPKAIREFAVNAGDNFHCVEYPDGYHCLHSDTLSGEVLNTMLEFCEAG